MQKLTAYIRKFLFLLSVNSKFYVSYLQLTGASLVFSRLHSLLVSDVFLSMLDSGVLRIMELFTFC